MSVGFLVAGFLATTNAGRVGLARLEARAAPSSLVVAVAAGFALAAIGALLADELLDALAISPESFRIAAGLVLAVTGVRILVAPAPAGPFAAVLVTPELAAFALSAGADASTSRVLGTAAAALLVAAAVASAPGRVPLALVARFLAALQLVVAVALVVAGIRDV
jgi:small neutral amino acid transporter SnatA (MarC family)